MKTRRMASTLFASSLLLGAASISAPAFSAAPTPLVTISGVDHVGINVPDLSKAIAFFQTTFGATLESDITPGAIPDEWKTAFNWHQSSDLKRFVMMRLPSGITALPGLPGATARKTTRTWSGGKMSLRSARAGCRAPAFLSVNSAAGRPFILTGRLKKPIYTVIMAFTHEQKFAGKIA